MDSPLHITVYDKDFNRTCWVDDFDRIKVNPRHLLQPTAEFDVPIDYRFMADLTARGARITIDLDDEQVFSGPLRPWNGSGPTAEGLVTFTAEDDARLLWNLIGYPSPSQPTDTQNAKEDARSGNAETVVKGYISANVGRYNRPYVIAPNQNRGGTISTAIRMLPLADKLLPLMETAGIGLTVRQVNKQLVVDCYTQRLFPLNLSEDAGVVQDYSLSYTPWTATRAIIGGPNEGTSREFKLYVDTAREAITKDPLEIIVDAGDLTIASEILAKGKAAVDEAGEKYGATVTLDETSIFAYGGPDGIRVGDKLSIELGPGIPTIVDVVREPELSHTREDGYKATFSVGDQGDHPDAIIANTLDELLRTAREYRTR